jgi:hypothetical protein
MAIDTVSLLTGAGMVAAGAIPVIFVRRQRELDPPHERPRASFFWWGALAWLLGGMIFKALAAYALVGFIERSKGPTLWATLGLLTGVFECGLLLLLAATRPSLRRTTWLQAAAVGAGFGAAEAFVLSIDAFLPETPLGEVSRWEGVLSVGVPALERFNAMFIHACACAFVLLSLRTGRRRWFWTGFAYKTLVDGFPIELLEPWGILAMEAVYVLFGVAGVIGLYALRARWPRRPAEENGLSTAQTVIA